MLVLRPNQCCGFAAAAALVASLSAGACGTTPVEGDISAKYDEKTGKLGQLTVNAGKDGKPDVFSYMDGGIVTRIEIDNNEDGRIDRWEYYAAGQKLEKVGSSRSDDGKPDSWFYQGADGTVSKVEHSTRKTGKVDRTEFYTQGQLTRAEQDTDGDGRVDKWEEYVDGALASASFDLEKSGRPTKTINYR